MPMEYRRIICHSSTDNDEEAVMGHDVVGINQLRPALIGVQESKPPLNMLN